MKIIGAKTVEEALFSIDRVPKGLNCLIVNEGRHSVPEFQERLRGVQALIADFDGTLNIRSQWMSIRDAMTEEGREADLEDLKSYFRRPEEQDLEDARYILRSVARLKGMSKSKLKLLMSQLRPRVGANRLIRSFHRKNVAIVSFGIHDAIEYWVRAHHILPPPTIFGLRLVWSRPDHGNYDRNAPLDQTLFVQGCDLATMVSGGNKGYLADVFIASTGVERRQALVIGDARTDLSMMSADSVNVLIWPHIDEMPDRATFRRQHLPQIWPRLAGVLVSDSLMPLVDLRRSATSG